MKVDRGVDLDVALDLDLELPVGDLHLHFVGVQLSVYILHSICDVRGFRMDEETK